MLSAILHSKKYGSGLAGVCIEEAIGAEDLLTATVFERIAYLPENVFAQFINNLLGDVSFGSLKECYFWTRFDNVEPDVILRDHKGQTLIIEAKRYDIYQQQNVEQLTNEILAIANDENYLSESPIFLLALGGMDNYEAKNEQKWQQDIQDRLIDLGQENIDFQFFCCSWQDLYQALQKAIPQENKALQRILNDIAMAYDWHGIRYKPYQWLKGLKPVGIKSEKYPLMIKSNSEWKELSIQLIHYEKFPSFLGV